MKTTARRHFNSGLDPQRERRLRLSGITFNKPRGRDSATSAFEQKIHLVEAYQIHDITKELAPGIAFVELTDVDTVQDRPQVAFPLPSPQHYGEHLPTSTVVPSNSVGSNVVANGETTEEQRAKITSSSVYQRPEWTFGARRNLRRNADSHPELFDASNRAGPVIIRVVDPQIHEKQYRREEAQVELMTAYRNVLCDAAEWHLAAPPRVGTNTGTKDHVGRTPIHTVRIPALALFTCGAHIAHDIAKINQQALIKGFHRCPSHIKDWYAMCPKFRVEMYVPREFWPKFVKAFNEEPWPHPESIWDPGRLTLYPGLPVPDGLLQYEGWTGQRQEILSAATDPERQLSLRNDPAAYDAIKGATTAGGTKQPRPQSDDDAASVQLDESMLGVGDVPVRGSAGAGAAPPPSLGTPHSVPRAAASARPPTAAVSQ